MSEKRSLSVSEFLRRRSGKMKMIVGIVFLAISIPVFILYQDFPAVNSQIGPHQIASWIAVTLSFLGFISLVMGAGEMDV